MFYFNPVNDIDLDSYAYQLYDNSTGTGTAIATGRNKANVFTISVTNSTDSTPKTYWGRVAVVNSAGTVGTYTDLVSSGATPLIGEQYISSLTAAKITSGTIGAHEITLSGSNSIIQSSTYDADPTKGWHISGDGHFSLGGENGIIFDGTQVQIKSNVVIQPGVQTPDSSGVLFSGLTINAAVGGVGGLAIGSNSLNYWYTTGKFRTGTADKYLLFDPAGTGSLTVNGTAIQNGTVAGISAATNKLYIGVGNHANADTGFYVDSSGNFSLKDKLYWTAATNSLIIDGSVTIGSQSASAVSTAVTTANNAASAAATAQTTANGKVNPADVLNHIGGTNTTTISGGKVTTGTISSVDGTCLINLDNGSINFRNKFIVDSAGNASFNGSITAASGTFSGTLSGASGSITDNLTIGNNVRINGATGDNSQSVVKIKADAQGSGNPNNYGRWPLNVVSSVNNTCLRVAYDARIDIGESGGVTSEVYIDGTLWKSSDIRLKENIQLTNLGLNFINKLRPVSYNLINEKITKNHYGFIAQDVKKVLEDLNADFAGWHLNDNDDKESTQVLSYEEFISPLVKAVQELSAKVDELESRLV